MNIINEKNESSAEELRRPQFLLFFWEMSPHFDGEGYKSRRRAGLNAFLTAHLKVE